VSSAREAFPELDRFCRTCEGVLSRAQEDSAALEAVRDGLCAFAAETEVFKALLRDAAQGGEFVELATATMFSNESLLYADPSRLFSLRLFLYGPDRYTPIHDHNAWGLLGPLSGTLDVINYRRVDDGGDESRAEVAVLEELRLRPFDFASTLPLDAGIHRVGNSSSSPVPSLNLYGKPIGRTYVHAFDPCAKRLYRIPSPAARKRRLAAEALVSLRSA
jgi:predicted metal-dependent enzyme (double-stranded beta helix superfamily)